MKIATVRIENFRCFVDETVDFNDYTCLVGANGAGKSTILTALRIFFRDATGSPTDLVNLQKEDFHKEDTTKDVIITVTFSDLEPDSETDFKNYVRQGRLVISAIASWNETRKLAEVKQFGQRLVMKAFADYFKAIGDDALVPQLKEIYTKIRESWPELPAPGTGKAMKEALSAFESNHPELCELDRSEDEFYGFTKGANLLKKYIQWVFVPAVKDASTEQLEAKKTALGLLLERTVRSKMSFNESIEPLRNELEEKYKKLLTENQGVLEELSKSLGARLREWSHPNTKLQLKWRDDPKCISIQEPQAEVLAGEGQFCGNLARLGHGLQRSFLLALLQELSGCNSIGNPRLLLACEEPELYQHPPQARYLSTVLQKLSTSNSQVIVSTHSPHFISGQGFQDIRLLRQGSFDEQPCVRSASFAALSTKLAEARGEVVSMPAGAELKVEQVLQSGLNEMFFAPVLILVEGLEDFAFVSTYLTLTDRYDEFRRCGCHIVPSSGKGNMVYVLAIASMLEIPTFVIFDADGDDVNKLEHRAQHEKDNTALFRLCGIGNANPFPKGVFQAPNLWVWEVQIGSAVREDFGKAEWEEYEQMARKKRGIVGVPDIQKNLLFIGLVLTMAYEDGKRSRVLDALCNQMISFARQAGE